MWDKLNALKSDLLSILDAGPSAVTADEAMARSRATDGVHAPDRRFKFPPSRRRGGLIAVISFAVVIAVLVGLLLTNTQPGGLRPRLITPSRTSNPSAEVAETVPSSVYEKVGLPSELVNYPKRVAGHKPLVTHGLPKVLYIWASYCPFCAAENWALVLALSRFGTFSGLSTTSSSVSDFAPNTKTLSFYGSRYSSRYLTFTAYDIATNQPAASTAKCNVNGYACLQIAPTSDTTLFETVGMGSMPFIDFANQSVQTGAAFEDQPFALKNLTVSQIASLLSSPKSAVALAEVGSANYLIGAICAMTGDHPTSVCSTPIVHSAQEKEGVGQG